ncbi:MAG: NifB/NifX family molybdenum-iron cluster-binding protein [Desulfobacterales bacterium]|nr:NifB/NifX family molybdenum-iron cluster-binding protein [Desulfobacterales bacterium]MDX2513011.1 NifB/NifX family molybdenum-iron cluster-binding protein [Desulfobacterales bacterium]
MKIAFPTQENKGLDSAVYSHFGSAPVFVVVDAESGELEILDNQDLGHEHGNCQPLAALGGTPVDAVVVGGIGGGALKKLADAGVKTYRAVEGTVSENLSLIKTDKLPLFAMDQTCQGHQGIGDCVH